MLPGVGSMYTCWLVVSVSVVSIVYTWVGSILVGYTMGGGRMGAA